MKPPLDWLKPGVWVQTVLGGTGGPDGHIAKVASIRHTELGSYAAIEPQHPWYWDDRWDIHCWPETWLLPVVELVERVVAPQIEGMTP